MRAAVTARYGGPEVTRVEVRPRPAPRSGEVLVGVHRAAVTTGDARIRAARFPRGFAVPARLALGLRGPRRDVLGICFAGTVEALGDAAPERSADGIRLGDRVCGMTGAAMGAHAEFLALPVAKAVPVPDGVSLDDAAGLLFGGTTALHFLRDRASVSPGMTVLVNGASGAVGTNAVQLGRHLGAEVTAVASGRNAALVEELGADHVIDHTRRPLSQVSQRYDVVLDAVGNLGVEGGRRLLADGGVLALVVAGLGDTLRARGPVVAGSAPEKPEDMAFLLGLVASGQLRVVTDRTYPLAEVAEAHRHVDTGHKVGNVLLDLTA